MLIKNIEKVYNGVSLSKYVIMPNHVHLLLVFSNMPNAGRDSSRPMLQTIIRSFKTLTTRQIGCPIWQDGFYEHVTRNEEDYMRIWQYIENNPAKWAEDKYYT